MVSLTVFYRSSMIHFLDFSNVISQLEKTLDRLDNQSGQNRPRSRSETRSIPVDQMTNNSSFGDTYHQLNRTIREQP